MAEKQKVLFVGEHPWSSTGNGNMMSAILERVDTDKFDILLFLVNDTPPSYIEDPFNGKPFKIITPGATESKWGESMLVELLGNHKFDSVVFVGLDIWRYLRIFPEIDACKKKFKFKWSCIFPYDLFYLRTDWLSWINYVDFPYVYSRYGFELLKPAIPRIRYFRPPLHNSGTFHPVPPEVKAEYRAKYFPDLPKDAILFGFVGSNQIRKNIIRTVKGSALAISKDPRVHVYMHTEPSGVYNIQQLLQDYDAPVGNIRFKGESRKILPRHLLEIYHTFDAYMLFSLQEGLSWTVLEMMLCGIPVLASDSTAHTELLEGDCGILVPPSEIEYHLPLATATGVSYLESKACSAEDIASAMLSFSNGLHNEGQLVQNARKRAVSWLSGVSDINDLLEVEEILDVKDEILFAQHSSAGDILMTTKVFKGLKERHPGKKLVYMTQKKFHGLLKNNPYVDEVIEWNATKLRGNYKYTYSPHNDKILKGGWNHLDVQLQEMYHILCGVEPDVMFLYEEKPKNFHDGTEYIVVQTTGGDPRFRTYEHMNEALKDYVGVIVQIGGPTDLKLNQADIDLRGKLNWNEAAWVMRGAKAAVVIDSFPAHLAGYTDTPAVILFGPAPARVTRPLYTTPTTKNVCLEPNRVIVCPFTTTCWGNVQKSECQKPCINTIKPEDVALALASVLEED